MKCTKSLLFALSLLGSIHLGWTQYCSDVDSSLVITKTPSTKPPVPMIPVVYERQNVMNCVQCATQARTRVITGVTPKGSSCMFKPDNEGNKVVPEWGNGRWKWRCRHNKQTGTDTAHYIRSTDKDPTQKCKDTYLGKTYLKENDPFKVKQTTFSITETAKLAPDKGFQVVFGKVNDPTPDAPQKEFAGKVFVMAKGTEDRPDITPEDKLNYGHEDYPLEIQNYIKLRGRGEFIVAMLDFGFLDHTQMNLGEDIAIDDRKADTVKKVVQNCASTMERESYTVSGQTVFVDRKALGEALFPLAIPSESCHDELGVEDRIGEGEGKWKVGSFDDTKPQPNIKTCKEKEFRPIDVCLLVRLGVTALPDVYLIMEKLDGTMDKLIKDEKLEWSQVVAIAWQLVKGLQQMHEAGLAHRDMKLENAGYIKTESVTTATPMAQKAVKQSGYHIKLFDFDNSCVSNTEDEYEWDDPKAIRTGTLQYFPKEYIWASKMNNKLWKEEFGEPNNNAPAKTKVGLMQLDVRPLAIMLYELLVQAPWYPRDPDVEQGSTYEANIHRILGGISTKPGYKESIYHFELDAVEDAATKKRLEKEERTEESTLETIKETYPNASVKQITEVWGRLKNCIDDEKRDCLDALRKTLEIYMNNYTPPASLRGGPSNQAPAKVQKVLSPWPLELLRTPELLLSHGLAVPAR